jgi:hypothetical protein
MRLASCRSSPVPESGRMRSSPPLVAYVAPEQLLGRPADARSDSARSRERRGSS